MEEKKYTLKEIVEFLAFTSLGYCLYIFAIANFIENLWINFIIGIFCGFLGYKLLIYLGEKESSAKSQTKENITKTNNEN